MKKGKFARTSGALVCTPLFPGLPEVIPAPEPVEFRVGTEVEGADQLDLGRPVAPLARLSITDDELELARLGLGRVNAHPFGTPVVQYVGPGEVCDDRR